MTQIEIAQRALDAKKAQLENAYKLYFNHIKQANGQPMNDKKNGSAWFRRRESFDDQIRRLKDDVERLVERIRVLKRHDLNKKNNRNKNGTIDYCNVNNIELVKNHKLKRVRDRAAYLQYSLDMSSIADSMMSNEFRLLIESKKIKRWDKLPHLFFVKGFKVAVFIKKTGDVSFSENYYPCSADEEEAVIKFLGIDIKGNRGK